MATTSNIFIRGGELAKVMGHFYESAEQQVGAVRVTTVTRRGDSVRSALKWVAKPYLSRFSPRVGVGGLPTPTRGESLPIH